MKSSKYSKFGMHCVQKGCSSIKSYEKLFSCLLLHSFFSLSCSALVSVSSLFFSRPSSKAGRELQTELERKMDP